MNTFPVDFGEQLSRVTAWNSERNHDSFSHWTPFQKWPKKRFREKHKAPVTYNCNKYNIIPSKCGEYTPNRSIFLTMTVISLLKHFHNMIVGGQDCSPSRVTKGNRRSRKKIVTVPYKSVFVNRFKIKSTDLVCWIFITRIVSRDKISLVQNMCSPLSFPNTYLLFLFIHFYF